MKTEMAAGAGPESVAPGFNRPLPARCYASPEFFDLEVERLLRPGWHAVARWDDLPNSGDYRSLDLFGERILLVRGMDSELHALSGVCLHRAYPIAEGEGHATSFVCPYHRWTYALDGALKGAPFMEDVPGFDRTTCRLPEFPLELWQGFVMVSTNLDAPPLASQLWELSDFLRPTGLDTAVHANVSEWDSPWNWKVMVDNFMESYHHIGPHVETLARTHPARGTHDVPVGGPCSVLENPAAVEEVGPFWVIHAFPTLMFAVNREAIPFYVWYEMQIDRHDHFHLRIHTLIAEAAKEDSEQVDVIQDTLRKIHLEDIPACEGVQRGVQSRIWRPFMLSAQEATLAHFHRFIAEQVGPDQCK